jgi:hypothetical protein
MCFLLLPLALAQPPLSLRDYHLAASFLRLTLSDPIACSLSTLSDPFGEWKIPAMVARGVIVETRVSRINGSPERLDHR